MAKKIYVFDTSVCLTDFNSAKSFGNNDIVLPLKVLDEIDGHKNRQDGVGSNARQIIRFLDSCRVSGNLLKGVRIGKGLGLLSVKNYDPSALPEDLDVSFPDNQIIATALTEKNNNPRRKIIVVSRDINMRVKCDAVGLLAEDYSKNQVVKHTEEVYTGFTKYLVDDQDVDRFYSGEDVFAEKEEISLYVNQFVMLVSNSNEKKTALAKFVSYTKPLKKVLEKMGIWSVKPKNKEQNFAFNLLMDPAIPVVSLIGKAGSGKTLMAIAAGLEQVIGDKRDTYRRLIVSRPIQPMGKDLGYLPGTLEEKMAPWLAPVQDNLRFLFGDDNMMLNQYMQKNIIEIEALTYIRGRSIQKAFIVVDECQNLTRHEIKTILTRVGEGTKIVLTGDIEQIDNVNIDETSNGLTYAIEKLKYHDITGHITFIKGERSQVATLCARSL